MRDYAAETASRVEFIRKAVADARADGIVFANSGGKDCVLAGILCKKACANTVGLILPCGSKRNYGEDAEHARLVAGMYDIETREIDLGPVRSAFVNALLPPAPHGDGGRMLNLRDGGQFLLPGEEGQVLPPMAYANIAPRLRMLSLYTIGNSENRLVCGTGNRSERYMGYFTKHGDGAYDFNPIYDLTVTEIYDFLRFLRVPDCIIDKPPSAGLYEGQTDEGDMGVTYAAIDKYIIAGGAEPNDVEIINRYHSRSEHKRKPPLVYGSSD